MMNPPPVSDGAGVPDPFTPPNLLWVFLFVVFLVGMYSWWKRDHER